MRACIRGAAASIGSSCLELEHDGVRLILDAGLPLDADLAAPRPASPVPGLLEGDPAIAAVVLSHAHPDHAGLVAYTPPQIPVWGPADAQRMLNAGARFVGRSSDLHIWRGLRDGQERRFGPFTITPIAVDHSAYESYALLVEAGGRRLLYSGDLRAHGRKPGMWRRLIEDPPRDVHALVLEGTTLSRTQAGISEQQVEERAAQIATATRGMVLAFYSGQNIDRLVSLYRAARRAGRTFVIDLYGAAIAAATGRSSIPQAGWENVRVYVPHAQRRRVIENRSFEQIDAIKASRIYPEELQDRAHDFVLTTRGSMTRELDRADCLDGAAAIWSMWPGYLRKDSGERLTTWLEEHQIELSHVHASGHAHPDDLAALAAAIAPERVVPIHTAAPERYSQIYTRIEAHDNDIWWDV